MDRSIKSIAEYFEKANTWREEMLALYRIVQEEAEGEPVSQALKWSQPCFTWDPDATNMIVVSSFKDGATLNLFRGALLSDPEGVLIVPGEHSRAGRFLRFTSLEAIHENDALIRATIQEVFGLHRDGKKVDFQQNREVDYPEELIAKMEADPDFAEAFEALTPGRRRGYLIFFVGAKQSQTRTNRIDKYEDKIRAGKGMQDR
ncbi:hypothetical protein HCZ30_07640 [Marivivens donghaensis]|uniref:YdhG-like domain-containing protein n=1 Tax=Marivivens donghaensis TaxID=1699413 RepID=A0ABX0VW36_9RHOB|nr:YdeI/OmpD-associated family protein [Marivivens donghaensis]NIY72307.1 hypothetical protein [Marivivens donghaensis]